MAFVSGDASSAAAACQPRVFNGPLTTLRRPQRLSPDTTPSHRRLDRDCGWSRMSQMQTCGVGTQTLRRKVTTASRRLQRILPLIPVACACGVKTTPEMLHMERLGMPKELANQSKDTQVKRWGRSAVVASAAEYGGYVEIWGSKH
jgi:hypothetical protein